MSLRGGYPGGEFVAVELERSMHMCSGAEGNFLGAPCSDQRSHKLPQSSQVSTFLQLNIIILSFDTATEHRAASVVSPVLGPGCACLPESRNLQRPVSQQTFAVQAYAVTSGTSIFNSLFLHYPAGEPDTVGPRRDSAPELERLCDQGHNPPTVGEQTSAALSQTAVV